MESPSRKTAGPKLAVLWNGALEADGLTGRVRKINAKTQRRGGAEKSLFWRNEPAVVTMATCAWELSLGGSDIYGGILKKDENIF